MPLDKDKIMKAICDRIAQGESLLKICKDKDMPARSTINEWLKLKPYSDNYEKATLSPKYLAATTCRSNPKGSTATALDDYRVQNAKKTNKRKFPVSQFYIAKIDGFDLYKLGVSQDTHRRLRDLQSAMPYDITKIVDVQINSAYDFECHIHGLLINKYVKREWFKLDSVDVKFIIKEIAKWQDR